MARKNRTPEENARREKIFPYVEKLPVSFSTYGRNKE